MTPDEKLTKRIEIAARMSGSIYQTLVRARGYPLGDNDKAKLAREALDIADAIIDTATGDMTAKPTDTGGKFLSMIRTK